jgi:hypothetical protein
MPGDSVPFRIQDLNSVIDRGIYGDKHSIIVVWGELGTGKTTLALQMAHRVVPDWNDVLSFRLEPHVCLKCKNSWNADEPYVYELPCPKCSKETETKNQWEAINAVRKECLVKPFPVNVDTGLPKKFPKGTKFVINTGKARGETSQVRPYLNFSFYEFRHSLKNAVDTRLRLPLCVWDDVAVYFHRSNIQYMHPEVKNFFSRYNFIRKYVGNVIITVPTIEFVPTQLVPFITGDILLNKMGAGDFDVKKIRRSFYGNSKAWMKSYDARDVTWNKVPDEWFTPYEEIRHAHAVEAFEKPEEIFVTTMPKAKAFTEKESLFD